MKLVGGLPSWLGDAAANGFSLAANLRLSCVADGSIVEEATFVSGPVGLNLPDTALQKIGHQQPSCESTVTGW